VGSDVEIEADQHRPDSKSLRADYRRGLKVRGDRAVAIDAYVGEEPSDRPLVVFHHIKKTAGTALRLAMFENYADAEHRVASMPRRGGRHAWWAELYESTQGRLLAVAGHEAAFLLAVVGDRPVSAGTILRDPVDRVLSRYHFLAHHKQSANMRMGWSLEKLYVDLDGGASAASTRAQEFCNGQSRSLLEPHYDVAELPLLAEHPDGDLWRTRLFEDVLPRYLLGAQERFAESVDLFADRFGWASRRVERVRVNQARPRREELSGKLHRLIQRYNWLDQELHGHAIAAFERSGSDSRNGGLAA
jgi:hypothetical protein